MADLEENRNEKLVDLLNTSYEQGVVDALLWVNEECNKKPDDDCDSSEILSIFGLRLL